MEGLQISIILYFVEHSVTDYGQLVPKTIRTQYNLYPGQLVPKTTRTQDDSYPRQPVPKTTRTQGNLYPAVWLLQYKRG